MFDLQGRVILVSGGARGMGLAECRLFSRLGASVVLADVRQDEGRAAVADIGEERAVFAELDVTDPAQWVAATALAVDRFGKLDGLVNNAGIFGVTPIETCSPEDYLQIVRVNQLGTFLGIQAVVQPMRAAGGGSIVNVSSIAGLQAPSGPLIAYTASKFAVRGMTRSAAIELAPLGIRVNALIPGTTATPMTTDHEVARTATAMTARRQPIARLAQPEECANVAAFLLSDAASYSTGGDFAADGGYLAGSLRDLEATC